MRLPEVQRNMGRLRKPSALAVLGWSLSWYVPVVALLLLLFCLGAMEAYREVRFLLFRWTWAFLLSPSAIVWLLATVALITLPLKVMTVIPLFFDSSADTYRLRYRRTALTLVVIPLLFFVMRVVAWGSYPLDYGQDGLYMRMIPLLPPWPSRPLF